MGIYMQMLANGFKILREGKYSIGIPILAFKNFETETANGKFKKIVFKNSGAECKQNLLNVISRLEETPSIMTDNAVRLGICHNLKDLYREINDDDVITCDYSEALLCCPDAKPEDFLEEEARHVEDIMNGFSNMCGKKYDDVLNCISDFLCRGVDNKFSPCTINRSYCNDRIFAVYFFADTKSFLNGEKENDTFALTHAIDRAKRELYVSIQSIFPYRFGVSYEHTLTPNRLLFTVVFTLDTLQRFINSKRYVVCEYQLINTIPVSYFVRNTPNELEAFYFYVTKSFQKHDIESIEIDGIDVTNADENRVSAVVKKKLSDSNYYLQASKNWIGQMRDLPYYSMPIITDDRKIEIFNKLVRYLRTNEEDIDTILKQCGVTDEELARI